MNKIPSRADLLDLIGRLTFTDLSGPDWSEDMEEETDEELQSLAVRLFDTAEKDLLNPADIELCEALATATAPASPQTSAQAQAPEPVTPTPSAKPGGRKAPAKEPPSFVLKRQPLNRPVKKKSKYAKAQEQAATRPVPTQTVRQYGYENLRSLARSFNAYLESVLSDLRTEGRGKTADRLRELRIVLTGDKDSLKEGLNKGADILERLGLDNDFPADLREYFQFPASEMFVMIPMDFIRNGCGGLNKNELRVLFAIHSYADFKGVRPNTASHVQICKASRLAERDVKDLIRALKMRQILKNDERTYEDGCKVSNWTINWPTDWVSSGWKTKKEP